MPVDQTVRRKMAAGRAGALTALVIAGALALSGCVASSASPAASPTAQTPSSSTPTATPPPEPRAAFDGDCDAVVSEAVLAEAFGGSVPPSSVTEHSDPAALLGGASCSWRGDGDSFVSWLDVLVLPEDSVPAEVAAETSVMGCFHYGVSGCGRSGGGDGTWVYVRLMGITTSWYAPSDEDIAQLGMVADAVIADVLAQPADARRGTATPVEERGAPLPACADLLGPVAAVSSISDPQAGYLSDTNPTGVRWYLLEKSGVEKWCGWYGQRVDGTYAVVDIVLTAGMGPPSDARLAQLADRGAEAITVPGADTAWRYARFPETSSEQMAVLISVGDTRAEIRGDDIEEVAAAVAAALAG